MVDCCTIIRVVVRSLELSDNSRRIVLLGHMPPALELLDNHLSRLAVLCLFEPHDLANESSRLGHRAFPLPLGLCHQGVVGFSTVAHRVGIFGSLLSSPASLDRLSVGSFNGVCVLLWVDGTRQDVRRSNDEEADGECASEEGTGLARARMKGGRHLETRRTTDRGVRDKRE